MLGLFLLAFMYKRLQSMQALVATIVGVCFVAWATSSKVWFTGAAWEFPLHTMMIGVCGTLVIMIAGWLLGRLSYKE